MVPFRVDLLYSGKGAECKLSGFLVLGFQGLLVRVEGFRACRLGFRV